MAIDTVITSFDVDGEEADRIHRSYRRRSYTSEYRSPAFVVPAAVRTTITVPFDTIQYIHIETDETLRVYRNLSPEYWTVGDTFLVFDLTDVTQVSVYAADEATLYVHIAGE